MKHLLKDSGLGRAGPYVVGEWLSQTPRGRYPLHNPDAGGARSVSAPIEHQQFGIFACIEADGLLWGELEAIACLGAYAIHGQLAAGEMNVGDAPRREGEAGRLIAVE